jgi:uncharacterized integral membrane protein
VSELPLLPDQPSTTDQVRRFGPAALISLAALLFVVQNTESVTFTYLWFEFRWPLWILLIVFMAVGGVIAYGIGRRIRSRKARAADRDND